MPAELTCPKCGAVLPSDALEGLCPKCVGQMAFAAADPAHAPDDRVEAIFNAALALSDPKARQAFINAACGDDTALAARLRQLLEMHEGGGKSLQGGAPLSPDIERELGRLKPEEIGDQIGPYKLMEQIGKGGFGTVWVADQERPVRRRVALKIIKLGMDTKEVIARFEQERQALAMMDHPHIAKVLDAGATQWGRPFFVMELVRGIKITEYCDQANLPTAERLALFIQVCQAVQHAHQKGIIHRDLKPSNILVTLHDGVPVPKVIDFGVAKATQQTRLTDLTIYTQLQQMIGTPLYMSPEQAEMSGLDVDTRSDIYSLGVLLYELLTGRTPFDPEELMKQGLDEIRRTIREREPQKPSTFLSTMAFELRTNVAQHRQVEGAKLVGLIRGDLDWIVMKALEKDRNRRYETANGFARDVQRHLRCEPVVARPPSQLYRFRKFARRKPAVAALVGVSGLAVLALIGAAVAQVAFHSEQAQRKKVEAALQDAERARKAEEAQRKQKEAALVEAERARQAEAEARGEEAKQRHIADAALAKAEREGYFRRIGFAHREWEASDVTSAEELLDGCPAELRSWEWRYLKRLCHTELLTLSGFADGVQSVAVATNGHRIAAVGANGVLKVWDVTTGLEDLAFGVREQGSIARVAFNPSGTHLATGDMKGVVEVWETRTATKLWSVKGHANISSMAYSADGTRLVVSAGRDGAISVFDVGTGDSVLARLAHEEGFNSVAISSDGKLIASASGRPADGLTLPERPGTIRVWEASTGQLKFALSDSVGFVNGLAFSPDGKLLASAHADAAVRLWNLHTGAQESIFRGHIGDVLSVAFSADGSRLVSGGADRTMKVWSVSKGGQPVTYRGHNGEVHGVAFTDDGRRAISASEDGTVKLWDVTRSQEVSALQDDSRTLAFNQNGELLVAGGNVWNVAALKGEFQLRSSVNGRVAFSPLGKLLAKSSGNSGNGMDVWNTETHQIVTTIEQGRQGVSRGYAVAFSPDGTRIANCIASGRSCIVKMWEAATGVEVHSFVITTDAVNSLGVWDLAFSRDGNLLALAIGQYNGLKGGEVQIWDWKTPRLVRTLRAHRFCVWSVVFSPDGKRLASSGGLYATPDPQAKAVVNPGEVQVWDVESGEEIFNLNVPDNAFSVAFSPDGKRLVAANGKISRSRVPREVKIWDMETGLVAFTLRGFDLPVHGVAFSPDGKRIATVGGGTLKVFDAEKTEFDALPGLNRAYEHYSEVIVDTKASPKARANALLNRSQVLRHLNRPGEAEADSRLSESLLRD